MGEAPDFRTLSDVAEVILGQSPPGSSYNEDGQGLPFIQGAAEFGPEHPSPTKWCTEPRKVAEPGDLLLSVRAPVGRMNLAHERIAVGRGLAVIRGTECSTKFVKLTLEHNLRQMRAMSSSGMFESITGAALRDLSVPVPPPEEQQRIVEVIEEVDGVGSASVRARASAVRALDALRQALLREEPEVALGQLLIGIDAGRSPRCPARPPAPGEWGVLKVTAVRRDRYFPAEAKALPESFDNPQKYGVNRGDVLVTRAGGNLDYVGVSCVVDEDPGLVMLSDKTLRLRIDEAKAHPPMVSLALGEDSARAGLVGFATGSAGQLNVSQEQFRQLKIRMPASIERQRAIADTLGAALRAVRQYERQLDSIIKLRGALLGQLLGAGTATALDEVAA